jgi:hypothetical protein
MVWVIALSGRAGGAADTDQDNKPAQATIDAKRRGERRDAGIVADWAVK